MNGRNGPLSPESLGGGSPNEWSGISKYNDSPYPNPNTRGQLASPPISNSSNSTMNGGGFPARGSSANSPGNPSPPSSIARSSVGTGLYAQSESGRSKKDEQFEGTLSEHYVALKRYLASSLRDEKGNPRPNRARDKLLRLSPVQFQELSTDVFDELLRRQQTSALSRSPNAPRPGTGPPPYLLPKDTFHPKRNQARQKLSTLPPARFRDLATDVFYELERRFPRFAAGDISRMGSPASNRGPPSRNGTPVNGMNGMGPRMRRPSNASSAAFSTRSESRNGSRPPMMDPGSIPPSPGPPANDYGRPTPKTFQSNTIVPNKSTMVEDDETGGEDNDDDDGDAFGLEGAARNRPESKDAMGSETDKKLIEDYQSQVTELREKLDAMEDNLKQKDDELNNVLDAERGRASAVNMEKNEWSNLQRNLENKLLDAQNLNESLQSELERLRASQANTERDLRSQLEELRVNGNGSRGGGGDPELERENQELRMELEDQNRVTEEVRREAQEFLREMRMLSERSGSSYEREEQLTNTVNKLEKEVEDWRNRYARTKTQLRSMRASSIGLTIQQDASKYTKDSGFTQENGMVKDVHVTKFQISIDELLRTSRTDDPVRVMEFMKNVVVAVRRITQDIEEAPPASADLQQQQTKLKSRVSATANNLTTASRNFSSAKGLSPVSLLDAAASHLTAAVVELVRTVKIRPTPAGELEDDDDGNLEPVDTTGFFPVRDPRQNAYPPPQIYPPQQPVNNAPAFQGLRNGRVSTDSSMYSPISSPRESTLRPRSSGKESWNSRQGSTSRPMNGLGMMNGAFGIRPPQENDVEELKIYLEDQTALLVQNIQNLVSSIRSEASITSLSPQIIAIADVVGKVVSRTESTIQSSTNSQLGPQTEPIIEKLAAIREKLIVAREEGVDIANAGGGIGDPKWRSWNQKLPPMAFQVAKETKELVTRVDVLESEGRAGGGAEDDFS